MILVTGAAGFLGSHLVRALAERRSDGGENIRTLDIVPTRAERGLAVCGRVDDPLTARRAVEGCCVVVHLAGRVDPQSRSEQDLQQSNVEGTRTIFRAAVEAGCLQFIHMSSAGVYGPPRRAEPFQESDELNPQTPYQRSKRDAERALETVEHGSTTLNILRPAGMYGPGSRLELDSYRKALRTRWSVELSGGAVVHPTHVRDVVCAIVSLMDRPAPAGSVFNIGGERPILFQDLEALVANVGGVGRRRLVVPAWLGRPAAAGVAPLLALAGRPNPHLTAMARGARLSAAVDDRAFRRRYPDCAVVSLEAGIAGHLAWAKSHALV